MGKPRVDPASARNFLDLYETPLGRKVWAFLNEPENVARMLAASDVGKPAVAGLGTREELTAVLGDEIADKRWKQVMGHMVRQVMESRCLELASQGLTVKVDGGSLFSKASRYRRRLPHWGHLYLHGDKPDGGVVWGSLGADDPSKASDQILGFARMAAREGVKTAVVKVRARGTSTSKDGRKVEILLRRDDGAFARAQMDRLQAVLGKGVVAPDVDLVLNFR